MIKAWTLILGAGLVILGIAGVSAISGSWMGWVDIVAGVLGLILIATTQVRSPTAAQSYRTDTEATSSGALFLSVGLFAIWVIALATGSGNIAITWWNLGFACAYALLAIGAYRGTRHLQRKGGSTLTEQEKRDQQHRRSA